MAEGGQEEINSVDLFEKTLIDSGIQFKKRRSIFGDEVQNKIDQNQTSSKQPEEQPRCLEYQQLLEKEFKEWQEVVTRDSAKHLQDLKEQLANPVYLQLAPSQEEYLRKGKELQMRYLSSVEDTFKTCNYLLEKQKLVIEKKNQVVQSCNMLCDIEVADLLEKYDYDSIV